MKSSLILGLLVIFTTKAFSQAPFLQKKIAQARYNYISNTWQGLDSNLYDYSNNGLLLQSTSLNTTTGNWDWNLRFTNTYNSTGKLIQIFREKYQSGTWNNLRKINHQLTAFDSLGISYDSTWDATSSSWKYNGKILYSYNADNQLTETIIQTKDALGNPVNSLRELRTYDAVTKNLDELKNYSWKNNSWFLETKDEYSYTIQNLLALNTYYEVPLGDTTLEEKYRYGYYYNSNFKLQTKLTENYVNYGDTNKFFYLYNRETTTYDTATSKIKQMKSEIYDTANTWWVLYYTNDYFYNPDSTLKDLISTAPGSAAPSNYKYSLSYNSDKNIIDSTYYIVSGTSVTELYKTQFDYDAYKNNIYKLIQQKIVSGYDNIRQEFYYYNQWPLGVNKIEKPISINVFPNPTERFINFSFDEKLINKLASIVIQDPNGKIVMSSQFLLFNSLSQLNIESLTTGFYIINCSIEGKLYSGKFIKK